MIAGRAVGLRRLIQPLNNISTWGQEDAINMGRTGYGGPPCNLPCNALFFFFRLRSEIGGDVQLLTPGADDEHFVAAALRQTWQG